MRKPTRFPPPFEHPPNAAQMRVDAFAFPAGPNHLIATGFEGERPEVGGLRVTVQPADRPEGHLDARLLAGRLPVLLVVALAVFPIGRYQFIQREPGFFIVGGQPPAGGEPFRDQPIVFGDAGLGTVGAKIEVSPGKGDDSLPTGFVLAVLWHAACGVWHDGAAPENESGMYRISLSFSGHAAGHWQVHK
jgi:hypothetical protein